MAQMVAPQSNKLPLYCHNELEKWHIEAQTSFTLYQQLRIAKASNKVGQKLARENLEAINEYSGVFNPVQNGSRIASFSNLTKIFIGYKNKKTGKTALSLDFLLQELQNNASNLRNFDLKYCIDIKLRLKHNKQAKELRKLRNQQIAHVDLNPETVEFSDKDFQDLLDLSNEILMFSSWCINNHEQQENYYKTLVSSTEMDFEKLLHVLKVCKP